MRCGVCGGRDIALRLGKHGYYYECRECHAKVGCHKGTKKPMGVTANKEMRQLRKKCHKLFDSMWNDSSERSELYRKLSARMGMTPRHCHFARMNLEELRIAIGILREWDDDRCICKPY